MQLAHWFTCLILSYVVFELELEISRALIGLDQSGYPTSALIGQNQFGDTKPPLCQCGCCRVHGGLSVHVYMVHRLE
jgi:hypothetical protein